MVQRQHRKPVALDATRQQLTELAALGPDWDSYGGSPPTPRAILTARNLVDAVAVRLGPSGRAQAAPYFVAPVPTGGVQLEWRGSSGELEVEVGPDGSLGYLWVQGESADAVPLVEHDVSQSALVERIAEVLGG